MKRLFASALALLMACSALTVTASAESKTTGTVELVEEKIEYKEHAEYSDYLESWTDLPSAKADLVLDASMITNKSADVEIRKDYDGVAGDSVYTGEESSVTYQFNVPATALYNIFVEYHTEEGKNVSIQRAFYVNGELPFDKAGNVKLNRVWVDETGTSDGSFVKDAYGNDIRPSQVENFCWTSMYAYDYLGYDVAPA